MRTREEIEEAFRRLQAEASSYEGGEDDEELQAIYDTLRWCIGEVDFDNSIAMHFSS